MHSKRRTKLAAVAATFATGAMLASAASAHAATEYQLTIANTPVIPNANQTAPLFAINNLGVPVGTAFFDGVETQPTLGAGFQRLTVPGDPTGEAHTGEAFDINDSGTVVGFAQEDALDTETGFGLERPFVWDDGAVGRELRIMPNRSVQPEAIDNAGDIVGLSFAGNGFVFGDPTKTKGFELAHDGTLTTLPPLTNGKTSKAADVSADGFVVGQADQGDLTVQLATGWRDGVPASLGTLGTGTFSAALAVNGGDVAVGFSNDRPGGAHHAVVFAGGTVTDPRLPDLRDRHAHRARQRVHAHARDGRQRRRPDRRHRVAGRAPRPDRELSPHAARLSRFVAGRGIAAPRRE
jgi:uncharacterized membrane protein